ncbi:MAG: enoyl-CoA hydratase/isomerase family protein [Rhodospirillales bacterium]|nr:enoyl-CoA hydratase/isomerase family protein [Rhodospirillales bacterium]
MSEQGWRVTRDGAVATVRLERPDKHNMLKMDEVDGLITDLDGLDADSDLRVIVLTGSGEKSFSAGVDLGDVLTRDWNDNPLERLADRIETLGPVTVCTLNGSVYGGATDLALACDFRIGVEGMRLVMPPAKLGLVFHETGLRRYVEKLGPQVARRLFLAAEQLDSAALRETGYLDDLVPRDSLDETVAGFAARIAELSPLSLRITKKALNGICRGSLDSAWLKRETVAGFGTEDAKEGLAAAREKRAPVFRGQ